MPKGALEILVERGTHPSPQQKLARLGAQRAPERLLELSVLAPRAARGVHRPRDFIDPLKRGSLGHAEP
ncbi:MAG TPA: hypothetical protein VFY36_03465 [Solirubrobacteraceae bacterium]|nr:hypothetical protein [Solirubrobacteraceae bacterium]